MNISNNIEFIFCISEYLTGVWVWPLAAVGRVISVWPMWDAWGQWHLSFEFVRACVGENVSNSSAENCPSRREELTKNV